MKIINTVAALQQAVTEAKQQGLSVGLVPTMGALHEGHASLIRQSVAENQLTVVSVFVNPTQFNDPKDLQHYPRTFEADAQLIASLGGDVVFAPSVEEVYPQEDTRVFAYPPIDTVMEGARRPGHFNGVCQIVSKLFDMVSPDKAYFGEKDFQQIAVVRAMMRDLGYKFQLVPCPIVREADGLALSSRNVRLTPEGRAAAPAIYRILSESRSWVRELMPAELIERVTREINAIPTLRVEYFEIVDTDSLQPIASWSECWKQRSVTQGLWVMCPAVWAGQLLGSSFKKRSAHQRIQGSNPRARMPQQRGRRWVRARG